MKQKRHSAPRVRYPLTTWAASVIGVSRATLYRALYGTWPNPALVRQYAELVLPEVLASIEAQKLPAGTRLYIPRRADRSAVATQLGTHASQVGRSLILLEPVSIAPAAPASERMLPPDGIPTLNQKI